ncbi:hypothetical protein GOV12_03450 [Candidatus Pacearchaeota archaeon]|nr:hypothetical protein [Candidatus Pacearchaeota archaeon]
MVTDVRRNSRGKLEYRDKSGLGLFMFKDGVLFDFSFESQVGETIELSYRQFATLSQIEVNGVDGYDLDKAKRFEPGTLFHAEAQVLMDMLIPEGLVAERQVGSGRLFLTEKAMSGEYVAVSR